MAAFSYLLCYFGVKQPINRPQIYQGAQTTLKKEIHIFQQLNISNDHELPSLLCKLHKYVNEHN